MPVPSSSRSPRRGSDLNAAAPTAALFVRIPTEQARRLDRAAFELRVPKQSLVSGLVERYVDPDSPDSLRALRAGCGERGRRRVTVETLDGGELTLGHHSFRPRDPEVLTPEEAAELLQVEEEVVLELASTGGLPGRELGGEWRFARAALLRWLSAEGAAPAAEGAPEASGTAAQVDKG